MGWATDSGAAVKDYNLKLGPFDFGLTGTFSTTYDDNFNASGISAQKDIILSTGLRLDGEWKLTEFNRISLTFEAFNEQYLDHPQLDSVNNFIKLTPDTVLEFTVLVKTFTFRFYDKLSYATNPTDSVALNTTTGEIDFSVLQYGRFENTGGVDVKWDLNKLRINFGYNRIDIIARDKQFESTERTQHTIPFNVGYFIAPNLLAGVEGSIFSNSHKIAFNNESKGFSVGPFVNWELSKVIRLGLSVDITKIDFDESGTNEDFFDASELNLNLNVLHTVNEKFFHHISYVRTTEFGFISNSITLDIVNYNFNYQVSKKVNFEGTLSYTHAKDSGGRSPEEFDRYGYDLTMGYAFSDKFSALLRYAFAKKSSDLDLRAYTQNIWELGLSYDF